MTVRELGLWLWVLAAAVVVLGPALAPGYVLSYDMVWVPDLALTRDAVGLGSGLPRAVPSDAVVAALDEVVPGMVLQKLMLLGSLVGGALGVASLLEPDALTARLVAATTYLWNPLVAERLVIGHWPVLVGYAVAPWLVVAARRWHTTGRMPTRLWWLLPLGSLSASTGLLTAVLLLMVAATRSARRWATMVGLLLAANAPWLVAGLLRAGAATSDPAGAAAFALHDEGPVPGPLAALTLGGIWNSQVVPDSRTGVLGWMALVAGALLAGLGLRPLRGVLGDRLWWGLVASWVVGWVGASLTWVAPGAVGVVVATVPGGGLLRDGARMLVLCAPLLCLALGSGAQRLVDSLPAPARPGALLAVLLLPVALLPDLALGAAGRLAAVDFPADYAEARSTLQAAEITGDTVLLPFSSYRQPSWNRDRPVLDPTGRYLGLDTVADDTLFVGGRPVAGEDPRVTEVRAALGATSAAERAARLSAVGVGAVVTERGAGDAAEVTGTPLHDGAWLRAVGMGDVVAAPSPSAFAVGAQSVAWLGFVGLPLVGLGLVVRRGRRLDRQPQRRSAAGEEPPTAW